MNSFFKELAGGIVIMIVAATVGLGVNAVRSDGLAFIQKGAPVATVQHEEADSLSATSSHKLAEGAISLEEMKKVFDEGSAVIIDARSTTEYEEGHIPGSINVPHDELPKYMDVLNNEVSMDARVICYCRSLTCDFSDLLATELNIIGFQDVKVFSGGWDQWSEAGYPVEKGPRQ